MSVGCLLDYKEDNAQTGNSLAHDARFPTELFWGTFGLVIWDAIHITTPPNYTLSWAYGHARGFKQNTRQLWYGSPQVLSAGISREQKAAEHRTAARTCGNTGKPVWVASAGFSGSFRARARWRYQSAIGVGLSLIVGHPHSGSSGAILGGLFRALLAR